MSELSIRSEGAIRCTEVNIKKVNYLRTEAEVVGEMGGSNDEDRFDNPTTL